MKFEKITDDKIKIFLSLADLQKENIDYHSFMSNSPLVQNLFLTILDEANLKLGFNTENCKVFIETLSISNEIFVFTITKTDQSSYRKKIVSVKRKYPSNTSDLCIYEFLCINDFIDFSKNLMVSSKEKASLFFYDGNYYLVANTQTFDMPFLKYFYNYISEFASFVSNSFNSYSKIFEYGTCLIVDNALSAFNIP